MDNNKQSVGKCPLCGTDVVKTQNGYACSSSLGQNAQCNFFLFSIIGNRRLADWEVSNFLVEKRILLDGFSTKEGKCFTSVLELNQDGTTNMTSQIGTCPKCGGTLYVGSKSVSCSNYKHPDSPCNFTIWRTSFGHEFSLSELTSIISMGATPMPVKCFDKEGNCTEAILGLNEQKELRKI